MSKASADGRESTDPAEACAYRIDAIISSSGAGELFGPEGDDDALLERLNSDPAIMTLLALIPPPARDAISQRAHPLKSWREHGERWRIVLALLDRHALSADEPKPGEDDPQDDDGEQADAEAGDGEDEEPVGGKQVTRIANTVAKTFSFIPEVKSGYANLRQRAPRFDRVASRAETTKQRAGGGLKTFQKYLKKAIQFVGITGILGGAAVLMRSFPVYRIALKLMGTLLYVAYPVWVLFKNPFRKLTHWLLEDLDENQIPGFDGG